MQEDDDEDQKKKALRSTSSGREWKDKEKSHWSPRDEKAAQARKHGLRAWGGILTQSHECDARKPRKWVHGGKVTLMIHNLTIHIGRKSSGKSSACHMHHTWWFLTRYHPTRVKDCSTNGRLTMTAATFKGKQQEEQEGFPYWTSSPRFVALSGKRMDVWQHVWRDIHQSRTPSKFLSSICEVWNISALPYVCICAKNNGGIERLQERVQHGRLSGLHWQHWRN